MTIESLLDLSRPAVAVHFSNNIPDGLQRIDSAALSGCTYWKFAADGRIFYTVAEDHFGCPIGAHTHNIDLPEEGASQLQEMVETMVGLQYISMDEVPQIPQVDKAFQVVIYAPLSDADDAPDAVILTGNAKQMMLLAEATHGCGIEHAGSVVGRPTCAAIPAVMRSGSAATNLGCIGNRVYTELTDNDLYYILPGSAIDAVTEKLGQIVNANNELQQFHGSR